MYLYAANESRSRQLQEKDGSRPRFGHTLSLLCSRETMTRHWEKEVCDSDCEISWSDDEDSDSPLSSGDPLVTVIDGQISTVVSRSRDDEGLRSSGSSGNSQ